MDLLATWDWGAWGLAVLVAAVMGWFLFRLLSALVFRHVLLGGLARRWNWGHACVAVASWPPWTT